MRGPQKSHNFDAAVGYLEAESSQALSVRLKTRDALNVRQLKLDKRKAISELCLSRTFVTARKPKKRLQPGDIGLLLKVTTIIT